MNKFVKVAIGVVFMLLFLIGSLHSHAGPFDGKNFKGRIAYSADGNYNDEDDWAASAVALAMFARCGVQDKLVHFDYNCILPKTDPEWEKEQEKSVLGAAEKFGFSKSIFHDCQRDLDGTINSIVQAINASSAEDPLYFILAGPMEVPSLGIMKADPEKRKFVYCISHNVWNDGYASADIVNHNKRDVIPLGVTWIQITDQNEFLSTSPFGRPAEPYEWEPWYWMRDSDDPGIRFLWDRMRATTRSDCSDSGMAYFLLTGDEQPEIYKLRKLLVDRQVPCPVDARRYIRLEAENFVALENFVVEYKNEHAASQRISLKRSGKSSGRITSTFDEPYSAASSRYDVLVRYFEEREGLGSYTLFVNGSLQGTPWQKRPGKGWKSETIADVTLKTGDEISLTVDSAPEHYIKFDYVQLNRIAGETGVSTSCHGDLDDPAALPGQIIVAGANPGYLKYNGGGPAFLCGPDNPETFLFQGTLNADGTRSNGGQEKVIARMAKAGLNGFHCQMFRMRRCNIKDEGDDQHAPFVDHDPSKDLNENILNQWDGWLAMMESHGIIVHLEFYNDATDVELMGWKLDKNGKLHPDEARFITGIVNKFKHRKNIMWGIEESCNKLPRSRTPHFKKIGELIAETDDHNHPIVQSFVIPEDPEGDFPGGGGTSDDYIGDPNIRVVTWLHVMPHGEDFDKQHQQYLHYYNRDARNFVVMKNETFHHPRTGYQSRRYMWSSAMAGLHTLEAYHHADEGDAITLREDGFINRFFEQTRFHLMQPRDDLAAGSTKWVLARPGYYYVAYTYEYADEVGIKGMPAGMYDLRWFDTVSGEFVAQYGVSVSWGDNSWKKPAALGNELALYVKRCGF